MYAMETAASDRPGDEGGPAPGEFLHRHLPGIGKRVHRLGLALNLGLDGEGVRAALDRGVNYLFWTRFRTGRSLEAVRAALRRDRERLVLAGGGTLGLTRGGIRRGVERILRSLDAGYLDVYMLFWLGRTSVLGRGVVEELARLKEEGLVRAVGASTHDRPRAGRLAADSPLDLLMIRYNAAHPGAETDIFPHLARRHPAVVAYTATAWRRLLARPKGWDGPVMTAGDCYRFCLTSPHVDVVLSGPRNRRQLEENLAELDKGPLAPDEEDRMRRFGRVVHG